MPKQASRGKIYFYGAVQSKMICSSNNHILLRGKSGPELYGDGKGLCKIGSMFQILASLPGAILIIGNFGKVARQPVSTFETDGCTCDPPSLSSSASSSCWAKSLHFLTSQLHRCSVRRMLQQELLLDRTAAKSENT